jgi:hypothetical protein
MGGRSLKPRFERKVFNMSDKQINSRPEYNVEDPLGSSLDDLVTQEIASNLDRRAFLMRSALVGAMGVITGRSRYSRLPRPTAMAQQANGGV